MNEVQAGSYSLHITHYTPLTSPGWYSLHITLPSARPAAVWRVAPLGEGQPALSQGESLLHNICTLALYVGYDLRPGG